MIEGLDRRPLVAALLSFLQPGLGHLYLRAWLRAVLWAVLWAGSFGLLVTTTGVDLSAVDLLAAVFGLFSLVENFPVEAALAMFAVTVFATLDSYWLAAHDRQQARNDAAGCPHCGKELDPTLEFCHWCTTRLDEPRDG